MNNLYCLYMSLVRHVQTVEIGCTDARPVYLIMHFLYEKLLFFASLVT